MNRVSRIFDRFDPEHSLHHRVSFDVIGHVQQRAAVSGASVFKKARPHVNSQQASVLPRREQFSLYTAARSATLRRPDATVLQTPLHQVVEELLVQKPEVNKPSIASAKSIPHDADRTPVRSIPIQAPSHPLPMVQHALPTAPVPGSSRSSSDPSKSKLTRRRIRIKTERRRQQCRRNQARYRKKQSEHVNELEVTVKQLRLEIPLLEMQHARLLSTTKRNTSDVADEYFRLFSHGTRESQHSTGTSPDPQQWLKNSETLHQLKFLQSSMAVDIALGDLRGVEALIEQWRRYSTYFDDLYCQRKSTIKTSAQSIVALATLNVTVSQATIQHVFPHLLDEGRNESAEPGTDAWWTAALRSKLLGQRLILPCSICFEMDETCSSVVRIEASVDFLMALSQVLGSLEGAAFVLAKSFITPDSTIG